MRLFHVRLFVVRLFDMRLFNVRLFNMRNAGKSPRAVCAHRTALHVAGPRGVQGEDRSYFS